MQTSSRLWQLGVGDDDVHEAYLYQPLDHFAWGAKEQKQFMLRIIYCDKWWKNKGDPIFFYTGNEADVEVYVANTGLIWENAARFGALVLFAEHRYYGRSEPFGPGSWAAAPQYLGIMQALSDFANVLTWLRDEGDAKAQGSPVIAFGGSYGGVLAAWMRTKYPHLVAGAIAASAPLLAFPLDLSYKATVKPADYWAVVTQDATPAAGAAAGCVNNTRMAFKALLSIANSTEGRAGASRLLRLCKPLTSPEEVMAVAYWAQGAFDAYAMGNYPYPSTYLSPDADHPLPAWPMRAACAAMTKTLHMYQSDLLEALAEAAGLMYNVTGTVACFDLDVLGPAANTGPWDFQVCSEFVPQEQPYLRANGVTDMFWDQEGPWVKELNAHCQQAWGVQPNVKWLSTEFGGEDALSQASNIVLSNGLLDPWSAFGIKQNVSDTVVAVQIPEGAHHVDLMFSHPEDTPGIKAARELELAHIERWIQQHKQRRLDRQQQQQQQQQPGSSRSRLQHVLESADIS